MANAQYRDCDRRDDDHTAYQRQCFNYPGPETTIGRPRAVAAQGPGTRARLLAHTLGKVGPGPQRRKPKPQLIYQLFVSQHL